MQRVQYDTQAVDRELQVSPSSAHRSHRFWLVRPPVLPLVPEVEPVEELVVPPLVPLLAP
jgi:hypothetical protein